MNTKTAEVYTFARKTPSVGILFLASMLASRVHDKVSLSHLEDAPVTEPEVVEAVFVQDAQTMAEPETAPLAQVHVEVVSETTNQVSRDFRAVWDLDTAKDAFAALEASGKSKTAFAKENGFDPGRFKRWADRV